MTRTLAIAIGVGLLLQGCGGNPPPNGPGDYSSSTPVGTGTVAFHSQHPAADFDVFAMSF